MVIFANPRNTETTAWRVLTGPTEHTCKGLGPVEARTPRYTYDFSWIFPNLAVIATSRLWCIAVPLSSRGAPPTAPQASVEPLAAL